MNKINQIVQQMLEEHVGGEKFFENLDAKVQDYDMIKELIKLINNTLTNFHVKTIVSGKFGRFYSNFSVDYDLSMLDTYQVNGGLRNGAQIESLEPFERFLRDQQYIIIDDSYYSGKTVDCIKEHVNSLGGIYKGTFVIYDGSKTKQEDIHSLYRYYK